MAASKASTYSLTFEWALFTSAPSALGDGIITAIVADGVFNSPRGVLFPKWGKGEVEQYLTIKQAGELAQHFRTKASELDLITEKSWKWWDVSFWRDDSQEWSMGRKEGEEIAIALEAAIDFVVYGPQEWPIPKPTPTAIEDIHKPVTGECFDDETNDFVPVELCEHCFAQPDLPDGPAHDELGTFEGYYHRRWPCPTIRALCGKMSAGGDNDV
ncbi:hypothetical protein EPO04_03530 [Patescibacteria group bacterium]|nr:MAG: hypothetical protein EPO04_03530 [Patescibacteria group bacterium]